ncbi:MAG TPA: hypothetical protein VHG91_13030, partial [Longimicrobium sp.]|nr:hypothetical protein [Longimicrobium sp.]
MNSLLAASARRKDRPRRGPRAALARGRGFALLLSALVAACAGPVPEREVSGFSRDLAGGARHAERLAEKQRSAPASMSDREVVAAGYVERARLGIGSPFRLMEYALLDPRLTPETRVPLVWSLLDATRKGRGYELDPRALTRIGADARGRDTAAARTHLELIEDAVRRAEDPRSGELAVREAYRLAAASRSV